MPISRYKFAWWQWVLLVLILLSLAILMIGWQFTSSYLTFLTEAGLGSSDLLSMYRQAQMTDIPAENGKTNILVLGTDSAEYRDAWPLTDTILIASLDPGENQVTLLSLPRDLVLPGETNRINAIYPIYYQQASDSARSKTAEYLGEKLDVTFHYTVVISMDDVREFIDEIGGVDVEVRTAFVDYRYPREGVDIRSVHDPAILYETVEFEAGQTHLDGTSALKFMRSRHAQNSEGSDFARAARQQQVITAVAEKLQTELMRELQAYDLTLLARLYRFYDGHFAAQISFPPVLAIASKFLNVGELPEVRQEAISIGPNVIEDHNDFTLRVQNLAVLRAEIAGKLGL